MSLKIFKFEAKFSFTEIFSRFKFKLQFPSKIQYVFSLFSGENFAH